MVEWRGFGGIRWGWSGNTAGDSLRLARPDLTMAVEMGIAGLAGGRAWSNVSGCGS